MPLPLHGFTSPYVVSLQQLPVCLLRPGNSWVAVFRPVMRSASCLCNVWVLHDGKSRKDKQISRARLSMIEIRVEPAQVAGKPAEKAARGVR